MKKWIPVTERLPNSYDWVLVTVMLNVFKKSVDLDRYLGNEWLKYAREQVVAWMPLPRPYEKKEDEK